MTETEPSMSRDEIATRHEFDHQDLASSDSCMDLPNWTSSLEESMTGYGREEDLAVGIFGSVEIFRRSKKSSRCFFQVQ